MIDHSRIASGYDAEILLGKNFFRQAINAWFDSGLIETVQTLPYGAQAEIGRPTRVRLKTGTVAVPQRAGDPVDTEYNLIVRLPVAITCPFPTIDIQLDLKLHIALVLEEHTNEVTRLVDKVDMNTRYVTMDEASRTTIQTEVAKVAGEDVAREAVFTVDDRMAELLNRNLTERLIPGSMQKMAVRQLAAEPGFQPCIAVYVNFKLKLGPLFDVDDSTFPPTIRVLPPEPDDQPVDRGDAALGRNFLPVDRDVVLGSPAAFYQRLACSQMHGYTKPKSDGTHHRPLSGGLTGGEPLGIHRGLEIEPMYLLTQPLGGFKITSKTHLNAAGGVNVETRIYAKLILQEDGTVKVDVDVSEPEADVSFFDFLFGFAFGLIGLIGAPFTGGMSLLGYGMLTGVALGMTRVIKESQEETGRRMVEGMIQAQQDDLFSFLGAIPSRVSVVSKRVSPFHNHHYQVVTQFKEVNIQLDGISLAGVAASGEEDIAVQSVQLAGRRRYREPVGELTGLLYWVPRHQEILDVERFRRPDPERYPDLFELSPEEVDQWVSEGKLKRCTLTPTHVRMRGGHVTEIYFDARGALAPFEAGNLQIRRALWVKGYKLITPRNGRPYYRSDPDRYESNNLSSLPPYECWRSRTRSLEFEDVTRAMIALSVGDWNDIYSRIDPTWPECRLISERVYRFASAYPLIQTLIEAAGGKGPIPETTFFDLDHAAYDPTWPVDEIQPVDAENWLPSLMRPLVDCVASLDDNALDRLSYVPLVGDTVSTWWLTGRLLDHLWHWHRLAQDAVWRATDRWSRMRG